jgi:hypothetical protein
MTTSTVSTSTNHVNGSIQKIEVSWDEALSGHFPASPAKTAWREAIRQVAENAKAKLPQCGTRIDRAVELTLAGHVELLPDGSAKIRSDSPKGKTTYHIVNGTCDCRDFARAFEGWCKHRIASAIYKRARAQVAQQLQDLDVPATTHQEAPASPIVPAADAPVVPPAPEPVAPLPEAPASCNTYIMLAGYKVQVTLRDRDEQALLRRMQALLAHFPLGEATDATAPTPPPVPEGWCRRHECQMTEHFKEDRSWFSHFVDGKWCRGK